MFSWLWDHAARRQDWQDDLGAGRYSLSEWVWATRTLPARLLGLEDRGRLSPGARADVAIYDVPTYAPPGQWHTYLGRCRTLLKAGEVVVDNFSLVNPEVPRATYYRETGAEATPMLAEICQFQSLRRGKPLGQGRPGRPLGGGLRPSCDHTGNLSFVGADPCVRPQVGRTRGCPPTDRELFLLL